MASFLKKKASKFIIYIKITSEYLKRIYTYRFTMQKVFADIIYIICFANHITFDLIKFELLMHSTIYDLWIDFNDARHNQNICK